MSGLKLKLNLNTSVPSTSSIATPSVGTPAATPGVTPGGGIKLKISNKQAASTPAVAEPAKAKKTKAGRTPKASAKIVESRKRIKEETDTEEEGSTIQVAAPSSSKTAAPPTKKIKLSLGPKTPIVPTTPAIVFKPKLKGKPPVRPLGDGYDSEASDREEDPHIEEEIILRMAPGADCDFLRELIEKKKIGAPEHQKDVQMKFFADGRRGAITIKGNVYAFALVDLPTVVEAMKSWDRRNHMKSADVCQMLWVFAPIRKEEEAKTIPLPAIIDEKTHQFPHGLTPPMMFARRNRFRHRLHKTQIEEVEDEVNRLLAADMEASETSFTYLDPDAEDRRASQAFSPASSAGEYDMGEEQYSEDEDAEGEVDETEYFNGNHHGTGQMETQEEAEEEVEGDLFDLEAALDGHVPVETPMSTAAATPSQANGATSTPMEEDSGDESIEGDYEDDDEEEDEIDEEEKARLAQIEGTREDIADLEKQIANVQAQWTVQANQLLRRRLEDNLRKLKQELQLKKSSIGEGEENE
jgi:transcription initiation factor TFIID subunit 7